VRFLIEVRNDEFEPEPDPAGLVLPVREYHRVRGRIEISTPDLPPAAPEDELVPLVQNLCFRAVTEVVSTEHAVVGYAETYGYVRLDLEGDFLRISGDRVPDIRVLAEPCLQGLVDCGARFRAWLRRLDLEGDVDIIDRHLADSEDVARAAIYERRRQTAD
jgi:hypothetical protein